MKKLLLWAAIRKAAKTKNLKELDKFLSIYKKSGYKAEALFKEV